MGGESRLNLMSATTSVMQLSQDVCVCVDDVTEGCALITAAVLPESPVMKNNDTVKLL